MRIPTFAITTSLAALAGAARADLTYLSQFRVIEAFTSVNNNTQIVEAPNFAPFVEHLDLEVPFTTPGGGSAVNAARVGIDCQLDPNAVRVVGSLSGSGGLSVVGGSPTLQFAEAGAEVHTRFTISTATPFRMTASPRPSTNPGDRYEVMLSNETTGTTLIEIDQTMPPQTVDFRGVLTPGLYELQFEIELTIEGPETLRDFYFNLRLGECYANCDESTHAPELTANDFMCFLNRFVAGDSYANCDESTSTPALTANDFVCFLSAYAAGCS